MDENKCIWVCIIREDNQDILDLIEKKPVGIVSLLDEACMFPKATHDTFAMKLFQSFPTHPRLEKAKFSKSDFSLSHYAGKACPMNCANFLHQCQRSLLGHLTNFLLLLRDLSSKIPQADLFVIVALKFELRAILALSLVQGVLEAVRISLAGYPTRRTYSEFVDRFGILASEHKDQRLDEKTLTERILRKLQFKNFQLGKSKVFLRAGQIAILDARRNEILDKAAKLIQCYYRRFFAHRVFHSQRMAAITIQAFYQDEPLMRKWVLRRHYQHGGSWALHVPIAKSHQTLSGTSENTRERKWKGNNGPEPIVKLIHEG
ncbi:hypothetical protein HPP92_003702 [Vanilla planifolia]|uniref:Myosin motor domain-containing protein n=1 Tax=Vanilla planifolia TaxID=51239 RepID=A0A835S3H5_VANPL|nr:hypothetical protein HPP92_003702 [Vanilla planifolia]